MIDSLPEGTDSALPHFPGRNLLAAPASPPVACPDLTWEEETVETITLWRPTGPEELALVEASGWRAWPPRLPDQPIFYPVLTEEYAVLIARDWNVAASGVGYVTRFAVRRDFADRYPVRQVGGREIRELWIPAEDLPLLNAHLVGRIEVVHEFRPA